MPIYLTHKDHGTHIVYDDADAKRCVEMGWEIHGTEPPTKTAPVKKTPRRGRPKKVLDD